MNASDAIQEGEGFARRDASAYSPSSSGGGGGGQTGARLSAGGLRPRLPGPSLAEGSRGLPPSVTPAASPTPSRRSESSLSGGTNRSGIGVRSWRSSAGAAAGGAFAALPGVSSLVPACFKERRTFPRSPEGCSVASAAGGSGSGAASRRNVPESGALGFVSGAGGGGGGARRGRAG